jgi:hypothetical protein
MVLVNASGRAGDDIGVLLFRRGRVGARQDVIGGDLELGTEQICEHRIIAAEAG